MNESIQQLTEKIYQEGIEKAQRQAKEIIDEATKKGLAVVDHAEAKAKQIIESAERRALELKIKTETEMRLSARNAMVKLKQQITDLVIYRLTHEPVLAATQDTVFLQTLIGKLMDSWLTHLGKEGRLQVLLPATEYKQYRNYLEERSADLLKAGISVEFVGSIRCGFQVNAVDQGFKINFTDEDFEHYFSAFARPRIYKLLFGKES
jgi:V/A-type H+-transporting ATPase subunit E